MSANPTIPVRFTQDEYGVVANSPDTFQAAAEELRDSGSVSLGWTDNAMSHLDVLLVLAPTQVGPTNRMDHHPGKLFVAVAGYGMFGFATTTRNGPLHHAYLAEKVGMRPSVTTEALADLVNGVMSDLAAVRA
jgi:hypothetical protein